MVDEAVLLCGSKVYLNRAKLFYPKLHTALTNEQTDKVRTQPGTRPELS